MSILNTVMTAIMACASSVILFKMQSRDKKKTITEKALVCLMKRELRLLHEKWMEKGYVTSTALGEFEDIYEIYHELGGNGEGTVWKNDIERLERRCHS